jgi:thiol-disulfide isomerase/thioredoxin
MRRTLQLMLLLFTIVFKLNAQNDLSLLVNIGDPAPPLKLREWMKGNPIQQFEKGHVYVLEFWATWCRPCIAAMPRLSELARKYRGKVTMIGIDVKEMTTSSIEKVRAFVDSMGNQMDYHVAAEDSNLMVAGWIEATGEDGGIPKTFIVNGEGRLAWVGHPSDLEEVLPKIVINDWDLTEVLAKRNLDKHLRGLDDSLNYELINYSGDYHKQDYFGKPDSALLMIKQIIKKEPNLQYAPFIAFHTFCSLLKTNQREAYEYGKRVLVTSTYEDPAANSIISGIEITSDKLYLLPELYLLGAEAYQADIDQLPYPQLANLSKRYNKMAEWYWRAKDKSKAITAQEKAIESLKNKKGFSEADLATLESQLQQYKNNSP